MSIPQDALGGLEEKEIFKNAELYTDEELQLFRTRLPEDALHELEGGYVLNNGVPYTDEELKHLKEIDTAIKQLQRQQNEWNVLLTEMITQMMFVSGETSEPSTETTTIIEEIVREQVVEMHGQLKRSTALAQRRGSRSISMYDLFFQIRHDRAKVSRLKTFLSWKDVRKTAKDSDEKGPEVDLEEPLVVPDQAAPGAGPGGGPDAAKKQQQGNKRTRITLPWETQSFFSEQVPEREEDEEEDEEETYSATMARLKDADERTKGMTREEYVHYSECRQASFTFRKGKRFREWAGFGIVTDSKPNDDIVDILGFLTFEIVQTLTEEALAVKKQEEELLLARKNRGGGGSSSSSSSTAGGDAKDQQQQQQQGQQQDRTGGEKRKRERGLQDARQHATCPGGLSALAAETGARPQSGLDGRTQGFAEAGGQIRK
ncbi:MAG: hypothetical protein Q9191_007184 [Dirinaria sp. TL-2023a]